MIALARTELLKLRTIRSPKLLVAGAFLLAGVRVLSVLINAGKVGAPSLGTTASTRDILLAPGSGSLILLVLGVVAMTTETRYGTSTWAALASPLRARIVAAKALAVAAIAVAFAIVATILAMVVAQVAAPAGSGLSIVNGPIVGVIAGSLLALPLFAVLGVAIGALVPNQVVAVVLPLVWFVAIENLLPSYGLRAIAAWLPGQASVALAGADIPGLLAPWLGGVVLAIYAGVFLTAGAVVLSRRDIT